MLHDPTNPKKLLAVEDIANQLGINLSAIVQFINHSSDSPSQSKTVK